MSGIPEGWAVTTLAEVAEVITGNTPPTTQQEYYGGNIPFIKPPNLRDGAIDTDTAEALTIDAEAVARLVPPETVLVACIGKLGKTGITTKTSAFNQQINALIFGPAILPLFGFYYCQTLREALESVASATTIPIVNKGKFSELSIRVAPLPEQTRVVAEIEKEFTRLDAATAALRRVQANLKRYRAAVLKAACEGRLVPTEAELARAEGRGYETAGELLSRLTGKMHQEPVATSALAEGWARTSLAELKQFSLYGPRFSSDSYSSSGKLVVRTSDISESGKVNVHTAPKLALSEEEFTKYRLEKGDLVFTRTGSLGTLAVFNDDAKAIPGAYLIQYRLRVPIESIWYIFYFFRSPRGQCQLVKGGAGVGRPNLNAPTIEGIEIPLPPLAEQIRITRELERRLSLIDSLEAAVDASCRKAEGLRRSVLASAFSGELVKQDPTDEPASVLLERIRQAKASQPAKPRARKERAKPARAEEPPPPTEPEPEPQEADFLELPRDEQVELVWENLLGQGTLEKDAAVRTVADGLRDLGLARFKRLRHDGPLYGAIAAAIEKGVREGDFDRPRRGCVRAVLSDPKDYTDEVWQRCLLAVTGPEPADLDATLRAAAEWARDAMGLEYARLREDGVILTGLREALEVEVRAGRIVRQDGAIRRIRD